MNKFKAVLFDLDGTLIDSLRDIAQSMNTALDSLKFPKHPVDNYKKMVGDGIEMLVKRALPEGVSDEKTVRNGTGIMKEEYSKNWNVYTKPYPGIDEMLTALRNFGIRMSIFSNKPHDFTRLTVDGLLYKRQFEIVLGVKDGVPKKPSPDGALYIAEKMSLETSDFLYLGDTATDMKTAVSAGMFPAGALWGFRDKDELIKGGAMELLEKPGDIIKLIQA